jgi:hypothetical protein
MLLPSIICNGVFDFDHNAVKMAFPSIYDPTMGSNHVGLFKGAFSKFNERD